jgi:hypothetical protein
MSVIFKLVGCGGLKPPEIKKNFSETIELKNIHSIFESILDSSELINTKFIANQITLTNDSKINVSSDEIIIIYVFTTLQESKNKLLKLFKPSNFEKNNDTEEVSKIDISKNIDVEEIKNPVLDNEIVMKINEKTIELFNKPNFKVLLNIWQNDPSVFNDFFPYINKGDIINIDVPEESKDKMFEDEIKYLTEELNIKKSPEFLRNVLRKYNGVLNFTIREVLPEAI